MLSHLLSLFFWRAVLTVTLWVVPTRSLALRCFGWTSHCYSSRRALVGYERKARFLGRVEVAVDRNGEMLGGAQQLSKGKLEEMEAWLDQAGVDRGGGAVDPPTARLRCFAGRGIGLEAAVEIERDSTVASIPRHVCFSSDAADAPTGTLRAWAHALLASIPAPSFIIPTVCPEESIMLERDVMVVTLQVFLERAAGGRSTRAAWMTMLNRQGNNLNLPALWPADDLKAMKGTLVLHDVESCLTRAAEERSIVAAALTNRLAGNMGSAGVVGETFSSPELRWLGCDEMKGRPTQAEWMHARCTVQSRAYRVGTRYLLIPLVDFANHDDDVSFAVCPGDGVFTGSDEVVLMADRGYVPGQEVCTTYGDMDNAKSLFSFGFVTLTQPEGWPRSSPDHFPLPTDAFCEVEFPILSTDALSTLKASVLRQHGHHHTEDMSPLSAVFPLTPSRPFVSQLVEGPARSFVKSAMPLLRLVALTPEEFLSEALDDLCQWRSGSSILEVEEDSRDYRVGGRGIVHHGTEISSSSNRVVSEGEIRLPVLFNSRISPENEREALRLLEEKCSTRLQSIDLTSSDVEALKEAADLEMGQKTFVATEPRRLLCATVRVAEAIAWHSLLEACARIGGRGIPTKEQTWASWVSERCRSLK